MKVIFSRKGFDSSAGGSPSPIVDGEPCSFPIPGGRSTRYRDLRNRAGVLVEQLTPCTGDQYCHLDPDIDPCALARRPGWRGAFGQVRAAQGHLKRQGVGAGDLFLFWGWFRQAQFNGRWSYTGDSEHRLFGWLQVAEVLNIANQPQEACERYPWLVDHPHLNGGPWPPSNTVYLASETLELPSHSSDLPGSGVFKRGRRLTAPGATRSKWIVPDWLNPKHGGVGLSHSCARAECWDAVGHLTVGPGQEFVANIAGRDDAFAWLRELFREEHSLRLCTARAST